MRAQGQGKPPTRPPRNPATNREASSIEPEDAPDGLEAEVDRLRAHSRKLNHVAWTLGTALGAIDTGAAVAEGDVDAWLAEAVAAIEARQLPVRVLRTEPGDVLVLECPAPIEEKHAQVLKARVRNVVGVDRQVLILGAGLRLADVVRPERPWDEMNAPMPPVDPRCTHVLSRRPEWMSPDQYEPCRCELPAGHEGEHECGHTRATERAASEVSDG